MGKLAYLAMSFFFAMASATLVAYTLAYTGHYYLGVPGSALREQALISAAVIFGLITIQFLTTEEQAVPAAMRIANLPGVVLLPLRATA